MNKEHRMSRRPPGMLPLFPSPYPGESFYSILCRYHVRSGNASDWHTSSQLFGYNSSLMSTLLTPFHLEMIRYWTPPVSGLDPRDMLHQNTAYDLYSINSMPGELDRIRHIIEGSIRNVLFNIVENRHIAVNTDGVTIFKVNGLELMYNMGKSGI